MSETISPSTTIGQYTIVSKIGEGGMGEVWRARDTRLGRDVAIKFLPSQFAADGDRLNRFEQEARATSALNHPNILTVCDIGNGEDVRMVECRSSPRFLLESVQPISVSGKLGWQKLDCDVSPKSGVACTPNLAHAT